MASKVPNDPSLSKEMVRFLDGLARNTDNFGDIINHDAAEFLTVANNLSDVDDAATARSNLGIVAGPSSTQTFVFTGFIASPATATIQACIDIPFAATLIKFTAIMTGGTVTGTLNINGTPVTNGALNISTTKASVTPSAANVLAAADDLRIVFSSPSSAVGVSYAIHYTRVLA